MKCGFKAAEIGLTQLGNHTRRVAQYRYLSAHFLPLPSGALAAKYGRQMLCISLQLSGSCVRTTQAMQHTSLRTAHGTHVRGQSLSVMLFEMTHPRASADGCKDNWGVVLRRGVFRD